MSLEADYILGAIAIGILSLGYADYQVVARPGNLTALAALNRAGARWASAPATAQPAHEAHMRH